eukprot:g372.t1
MPFDTVFAAAKAHTAVAVKRARSRSSSKLKSLKHKVQASLDSAEKTHVHFKDGSVFHGVLKDGQPHGHGKYTGIDGTSYKGSFRYGHRHGLGKLQLAEGVYEGGFENDLFHGKGRFRWTDGREYEGHYVHGKQSGKGIYVDPADRLSYKGQFLDDKFHGHGTLSLAPRVGTAGSEVNGDSARAISSTDATGVNSNMQGPSTRGVARHGPREVYDGQWREGKRHGQGTWVTGDERYVGQYRDHKRHGDGCFRYSNGNTYDGQWKADLRCGQGTLMTYDGDVYVGQWSDGHRHGSGRYTTADGDDYEGQWRFHCRHGVGRHRDRRGGSYNGGWKENQRHGRGVELVYRGPVTSSRATAESGASAGTVGAEGLAASEGTETRLVSGVEDGTSGPGANAGVDDAGKSEDERKVASDITDDPGSQSWYDRYEGAFRANKRDGEGVLRAANGLIYKGSWREGMRHGNGTQTAEGETYNGEWECDRKHGLGTLQSEYSVYQGQWHADTKCGHGRLVVHNTHDTAVASATGAGTRGLTVAPASTDTIMQEELTGEWFNDSLHGRGVWCAANGDRYEGEFKHGVRDGIGKFTSADGDVYNGSWKNGCKHGQGTWIAHDGDSYEGGWKDNVRHGKGIATRQGEASMEGCWSNGLLEQRYSRIESQSNIDASAHAITAAMSPERLRHPVAVANSYSTRDSWHGNGYGASREATPTSSRPPSHMNESNQLPQSPIVTSCSDLLRRQVHTSAPRPAPLFQPMLGNVSNDASQISSLCSSSPLQSHVQPQLQPRSQPKPHESAVTPGHDVGDTNLLALEDLGTVAHATEANSQLRRRRQPGSLPRAARLDQKDGSGARALYNDDSNYNFV